MEVEVKVVGVELLERVNSWVGCRHNVGRTFDVDEFVSRDVVSMLY